MSRGFIELKALKRRLAAVRHDNGMVPCWESSDYQCGTCPALRECRVYAAAIGEEESIHVTESAHTVAVA